MCGPPQHRCRHSSNETSFMEYRCGHVIPKRIGRAVSGTISFKQVAKRITHDSNYVEQEKQITHVVIVLRYVLVYAKRDGNAT